MDLRWSHEGVSLRASVRDAPLWRRGAYAMLGFCAVLTGLFFAQLAEPTPAADFSVCDSREGRQSSPVCDTIRPSFETWTHMDVDAYTAARACSLGGAVPHDDLVGYADPRGGLGYVFNLEFLKLVAQQEGDCAIESDAWRTQASREWGMLTRLEQAYWEPRIERAQAQADQHFARAAWWSSMLRSGAAVWLPLMVLLWITVLVGFRRMLRAAEPLSLRVHPGGVELDAWTIPREDVAFLSLEGRRLRVERWHGPPVYSRALPPEALVHADEIVDALGVVEPEEDREAERSAPAALRAMLAQRG